MQSVLNGIWNVFGTIGQNQLYLKNLVKSTLFDNRFGAFVVNCVFCFATSGKKLGTPPSKRK